MKYLIISLKSRNDIYAFCNILKRHNIFYSTINSPKGIGSSCMLSIKTSYASLNIVNNLLSQHRPKSFLGLFCLQQNGISEQVTRLQ